MEPSDSAEVSRIQAVYAARERNRRDRLGPGRRAMLLDRDRLLRQALDRHLAGPLSEAQVLDVGCGDGSLLAWLQEAGVPQHHLNGVDLCADRIERARIHYPDFNLIASNAEALPFPSHGFDVVLVMTVFSSILSATMARNVAGEIGRVVRPGGLILWYDMRYPNPWNPNVRAMTRQRIAALFPRFIATLDSATLIPHLARPLGDVSGAGLDVLYPMLTAIPVLRSHLLGVLRAPTD